MSIFAVKESHQALPWPLPQQVLAARNITNLHQGILIQSVNLSFSGSKEKVKTKLHNP